MKVQDIANILTRKYEWKKGSIWTTPGTDTWAFRYLVACILVGGTLEDNVHNACEVIFKKWPECSDLKSASQTEIADILRKYGVRFHGPKAKYIITSANAVWKKNGRVPDNRKELEKMPGVARHVASVILATVYNQNEFAVDTHVRRIAIRLGIIENGSDDLQIEQAIVKSVKPKMLGHFSRSFVDFGKDRCFAVNPICKGCEFENTCKAKSIGKIKIVAASSSAPELNPKYTTTKSHCTCMGFRFKRTCKHIEAMKLVG